ncbi:MULTISPECIES: CDP-alcohol phosphatidyltransferase family protein [unclassified Eubacterium (in: firmicutes)]|uniref:CDP-alcohol phosphatidyltransferase family protein n=1 Tax=Eubacterium TaxID=1730 RepID=UPI00033F774B|nr:MULTISPECIES: CDP-alcohol phosphatidyltransferase family protein [unclassified Eubacterium (in: firmicutes)]CDA29989.1 cDP-alcohol phosphatidyltransferase [Eubacterium sp. CAG:156]
MKKDWKREYFSIPNLMGYFRLILIPVYLMVYIHADGMKDYAIAAGILLLSALTDFFDGKVARRFDMITDWGKILDPIADKLTQGIVVISLIFRYRFMAIVLVIFIVQQLGQGILGLIYIKKSGKVEGAKMFGKVSTAFLDFMVLVLVIWIDIPKNVALAMMTVSVFLMTNSLLRYFDYYYKEIRK